MLGIPSYAFGVVAENWQTGTPTASAVGTILGDPGAAPHTKSATTTIIATGIAQPGYWIRVDLFNTYATGVDTSALCDIMYDPAGGTSWSVLIPNLICGYRRALSAEQFPGTGYSFPLYIPRGASIGARWQSIVASPTAGTRVRVAITIYGGPSTPGFWYGTQVTAVGADTATSAGLDHTPGSTGTYSAWTSIGGGANPSFGFVTIGAQGTAIAHTADMYHVQYGFGSTKIPGAQIRFGYATNESIYFYPEHPGSFVDVPSGTQMQIRATGSDASAEVFSAALYGVS